MVDFFHFSQEIYKQIQNLDCSNIYTEDIEFEFQIKKLGALVLCQ